MLYEIGRGKKIYGDIAEECGESKGFEFGKQVAPAGFDNSNGTPQCKATRAPSKRGLWMGL